MVICFIKDRKATLSIWKGKQNCIDIILFSIFGMALCQYSYFTAIGYSNAGTATVLQYIGPVMIMVYVSIRKRTMPTKAEMIAVVLAIFGTFLLATHGKFNSLVISKEGFIWGILSAIALLDRKSVV